MMKRWIFKTLSVLTGVVLPPVVGAVLLFATIPLIEGREYPSPWWVMIIGPFLTPEIFIAAFISMGPSALAYGLVLTWYGFQNGRIRSGQSNWPPTLRFICLAALIGLLAPLGTLVWASKHSSLRDWARWFEITMPAGAMTGALCAFPILLICRKGNKTRPNEASEVTARKLAEPQG